MDGIPNRSILFRCQKSRPEHKPAFSSNVICEISFFISLCIFLPPSTCSRRQSIRANFGQCICLNYFINLSSGSIIIFIQCSNNMPQCMNLYANTSGPYDKIQLLLYHVELLYYLLSRYRFHHAFFPTMQYLFHTCISLIFCRLSLFLLLFRHVRILTFRRTFLHLCFPPGPKG